MQPNKIKICNRISNKNIGVDKLVFCISLNACLTWLKWNSIIKKMWQIIINFLYKFWKNIWLKKSLTWFHIHVTPMKYYFARHFSDNIYFFLEFLHVSLTDTSKSELSNNKARSNLYHLNHVNSLWMKCNFSMSISRTKIGDNLTRQWNSQTNIFNIQLITIIHKQAGVPRVPLPPLPLRSQ